LPTKAICLLSELDPLPAQFLRVHLLFQLSEVKKNEKKLEFQVAKIE